MKSPNKSNLVSGGPNGRGGHREGAGRKPDWFKQKCADLFEKHKLAEYVAKVGSGEEPDADVKDRLKACDMLKDWGIGKTDQPITIRASLNEMIKSAEEERGL
jgi:hypothetical protein